MTGSSYYVKIADAESHALQCVDECNLEHPKALQQTTAFKPWYTKGLFDSARQLLIDIALRRAYSAADHRKRDRAYNSIRDAEYVLGLISRPDDVSQEEHDRTIGTMSEEISDVRTKIEAEFEPAGESR